MDGIKTINSQTWVNAFNNTFKISPSLIVLDKCSSTMDIAKQVLQGKTANINAHYLIKNNSPYTACFSLLQEKGRGRNSRKWESNDTGGIYLSLVHSNPVSLSSLYGFSLVIGLAILRNLKQYGIEARLKWPNDVLIGEKKIAGVLIETVPLIGETSSQLIIGIGLNVNQKFFDNNLNATSMRMLNNQLYEYEMVAAGIVESVIDIIEEYFLGLPDNCFLAFKSDWWNSSCMSGRIVENLEHNISGVAVGLTDQGALVVENKDGRHEISVGDVGILT